MVPATRISKQNTSTHYGTGPRSKSLRQVPTTSPLVDLKCYKTKYRVTVAIYANQSQARSKRRSIHAPNLTDELSTAEERRLNQFGSAD